MFRLFSEGGVYGMTVLTVVLICMLFAAWKAPAWVKELGLLAMVFGVLYQLLGIYHACGFYQQAGGVSPTLLAGGLKVSLIPTMYALLIYGLSLVIRMVQKPRI